MNGVLEAWSIGFLTDVILTRDLWMDLAHATGRNPALTTDHDGVIVADGCGRVGPPPRPVLRLELTGPAGGSWSSGAGGEEIVMDAADFCRVVSGRQVPTVANPRDLLATQVSF